MAELSTGVFKDMYFTTSPFPSTSYIYKTRLFPLSLAFPFHSYLYVQLKLFLYCTQAHAQDVNGVKWHPKEPGLLASCSDDGTIKIWKFIQDWNSTREWNTSYHLDIKHLDTVDKLLLNDHVYLTASERDGSQNRRKPILYWRCRISEVIPFDTFKRSLV